MFNLWWAASCVYPAPVLTRLHHTDPVGQPRPLQAGPRPVSPLILFRIIPAGVKTTLVQRTGHPRQLLRALTARSHFIDAWPPVCCIPVQCPPVCCVLVPLSAVYLSRCLQCTCPPACCVPVPLSAVHLSPCLLCNCPPVCCVHVPLSAVYLSPCLLCTCPPVYLSTCLLDTPPMV